MPLTATILLVLALYLLHIFLQETTRYGFDLAAILGNRDAPPPLTRHAARFERAKNNMLESLPAFLALALLALMKSGEHGPASLPASIFLAARVLYLPVYAAGIPVLRSVLWLIAVGAMLAMALSLAG